MFVSADDGCRLKVVSQSHGHVPVVLSNSLGVDLALWDAQVDALGRHAAVWRYDTRGHGESDAPAGEYSLDRLGRDLLAVIDETGADRVDLCGLSLGGLTALWVAIEAPHRVRRLVLANTAARIGDAALWTDRIRAVNADGMQAVAEAALHRWLTAAFRQQHAASAARFRAMIQRMNVHGYAACCAALRDADLRQAAGQVSCPTLVVTGRHDVATPPQAGRWLADQIRGARYVALDSAHLSNVECAAEFDAAVCAFLREELHG